MPRAVTTPLFVRADLEHDLYSPRPSSAGQQVLAHRPGQRGQPPQEHALAEYWRTRAWPPKGYTMESVLDPKRADDIICSGANTFKGWADPIPNTPPDCNRFYAMMESEHSSRSDRAVFQHDALMDVSLTMTGSAERAFPWMSLEQPSQAYAFGRYPGTTTLNFRAGKSGTLTPGLHFGQARVKPRKMKLLQILDRLRKLEIGLDTVGALYS